MKFDVGGKYRAQVIIAIIMAILFLICFDPYCIAAKKIPLVGIIIINVIILGIMVLFIIRMSQQMLYTIYDDKLRIDFWSLHKELNASDITSIALFTDRFGKSRTHMINIILKNNTYIKFEFIKDKKLRTALAAFAKRNSIGFEDKL